ncbi:MAG: DNA-protecting protein DprA [Dorea sp.]|jgi:DNA processing protein|nr:DNA-protecting protein DprA [Dorea sp.]
MLRYEWWFAGIRSVSDKKKRLLREIYGSGKDIYKKLYNMEEKNFCNIQGLTEADIRSIRQSARNQDVSRQYEAALSEGIRFIPYYMEEYPIRLKEHAGMPYALYVKGELPCEDMPTAAIVGARKCTPYGEKMAAAFAEALAISGVQVISGMARGIDGAAQRAAIQSGGSSFGVLGCGIDVCYPKDNKGLYMDLPSHGGILSEQPVGTPPLREYFPARNRIISGLSDIVLVIEAGERSGSLITADIALEQGKDIYALPGPVTSNLSRGCHELIRQGAGILISPEVLIEEIGLEFSLPAAENSRNHGKNEKKLERKEKLVYDAIGLFPKSLNMLLSEVGFQTTELMCILVSLEMKGMINEISKNYFVRA